MILVDRDIERALNGGGISRGGCKIPGGLVVDPLYRPIQTASIDIRVGKHGIVPEEGIVDFFRDIRPTGVRTELTGTIRLCPGSFLNIETLEYVEVPNGLTAIVVGKSGPARYGLQVESAGYVDPGWRGRLTLELKNLGPFVIHLTPGDLIAQLRFELTSDFADRPYGHSELDSHYQDALTVEMGRPRTTKSTPADADSTSPRHDPDHL